MGDDWTQYKEQGAAAYKAGDLPGAINHFTRAIEADKNNAGGQLHVLYSNRSAAYLSLGRAAEASADAEKCVQLNATWAKGHSRKGSALYRLGKYTESAAAYQKALDLEPSNADFRKGLDDARRAVEEAAPRGTAEVKTKLEQFVMANRLACMLFLPRLFLITNTLLYLLPFFTSRQFAFGCYRRILFTAIGQNLYIVYNNHGFPRFKMEYLARIMPDPALQYTFMCLLLITARPSIFAIATIILQEGMALAWITGQIIALYRPAMAKQLAAQTVGLMVKFTQDPRYGTLSGYQKWAAIFRKVPEYAALLEITNLFVLIFELLTPYRNFFGVFAYGQWLQMRYMLDRDGAVKRAFKAYDMRITTLTNHPACPKIIGTMYIKLREYLAKQTALPEPGQPRPAPRCTIS